MSSGERWIVVERWGEFQHLDVTRNSRGAPPWIKNYTRLLDSDEYLELTAPQRGVLHGIWLLYAKGRCEVRGSTSALTRRLGVRVTNAQLAALEQAGFISFSTRNPHAGDTQATRLLARASEEVEGEEEGLDRSSRSEITSEPRPDLTKSEDPHKDEDEQPFAREPEPELNGAGYDLPTIEQRPNIEPDDSMERLSVPADVEELVERWSGETA